MIDRYARAEMKLVWSEDNKYNKWLAVELAVCEAWAQAGVIPQNDMVKLRSAQHNSQRMDEIFQRTRHDMTAFTRSITESLGDEGRWIHLGLTSSDVLDTAQSLQLIDAADLLLTQIDDLRAALKSRAIEFKDTLMMGRTHGIHAEPITFGLKLALWWDEMNRQKHRLEEARSQISVGKISGAVGTHATVPPNIEALVCKKLGIQAATISNQIVQRDRYAQFVTTLALVAASLEKFATEIRHLQRTEVREVEEPFGEGQTGSSAMPHKRNPELSERVCGLARLIRGHAVTSLENVALWHERDISHSSAERIVLPDSCMALDYIINLFTYVINGLRVSPERMRENLESTRGVVFSQRVLISLIEKGLSRELAYSIVQESAMRSWDHGDDFRRLLREEPRVHEQLSGSELEDLFDYSYFTRHVEETFKIAGLR
ncbi:MAG: adenylosuccinate lyase [SAR202 cluster bacterium Io17-Chloro-G3]|nr:MAG: adenylosuccinate lyase [SAR202 cluster bacterium Io17-Chloro-G3]